MASQRKRRGRRLAMRVDGAKSELARNALRRMNSVGKSRVNALARRIADVVSFIRADP